MGKNSPANKHVSNEELISKIKTKRIEKAVSKAVNKRNSITLPSDFDPKVIYKPRFGLIELICTTNKARISSKPPRPLNSYFLLKKCLLLELWGRKLKPTMPAACILARELWAKAPPEAREIYEKLALQAQAWHHKTFPDYVFEPKKKPQCKNRPFPEGNSTGMMTMFTVEPRPQKTLGLGNAPTFISDVETTVSAAASFPSPTSVEAVAEIFGSYKTFEHTSTAAVEGLPIYPPTSVDFLNFKFQGIQLNWQENSKSQNLHDVFLTELPPALNCQNLMSNDINIYKDDEISVQFDYPDIPDIESIFL
ncbi:3855_t:CDS:1 [Ambispora gerdemannii]|uniref:3855_t:CDS:1 n=1 Tax=Ambispora gerdemannii TaxID=144530 RepID=A0A9N8WDQ4_9GLOM|nr:3855_t:CDS:1 [Ambispora gerdemannii]